MSSKQIIIDLEEYNSLLKQKDFKFDEEYQVFYYPNDLLVYLQAVLNNGSKRPDRINFNVTPHTYSITKLENSWLRTEELISWMGEFANNDIDLVNIKEITFGYITGTHSPLVEFKGFMSANSADYYQVWCNIIYKMVIDNE